LVALLPACSFAQWDFSVHYGWLNNICPAWKVYDSSSKPFSIWGNGWQTGGSLEYRKRSWLSIGGAVSFQSFNTKPSGQYSTFSESDVWSGETSWLVPVEVYARLIRPGSLLGTNLKLSLGVMPSHIGKLTVTSANGDYTIPVPVTSIFEGTGQTVYRPFGRIGAGMRIPLTARLGLRIDYSYLATFDQIVQELPLELGLDLKW
jgi:hypothetical protein